MRDIRLKVNLGTVSLVLTVWALMIGYQMIYPVWPLPAGLTHLFDNLNGFVLTIITSFQKETTE